MSRIEREKRVVGWMIDIWGKGQGSSPEIISECQELKEYCTARLSHCKFAEEKTSCKKCPIHCYKPEMREKIRKVMRYSGPRMIFYHPIEAIRHLIGK